MSTSAYSDLVFSALETFLAKGMTTILIVIVILVALYLLRRGQTKFRRYLEGRLLSSEQAQRAQTITQVVGDAVRVLLIGIGTLSVLGEMGIDLKPVLFAAGIGGLAIGFGAQSLIKDVITGFFILFEDQLQIGDVVTIAGQTGQVEEVRLRTTRLRELSGNVHIIPNGLIDRVTNWSMDFSYRVFDLGVAYREDVDRVMDVLKEIGTELAADPNFSQDILAPLEVLGVEAFQDSAVIIKFRIKTKPLQQWRIGREMNRRIKKVFDAREIEIPFPHRTLYWGANQHPTRSSDQTLEPSLS
ncbi:MAG: mechanosensitive ion channel family protein [Nitrospirales bacterium]|nr:mechanosensitive ion channel family protein [Nitrospira sp.]MDR4500846.1 mechanosensitive ion channel family protein [Nitrospirales bacterium]